ncbi:MAG: L,D-transpeptidase [Sedimenticolaceae bacterium]
MKQRAFWNTTAFDAEGFSAGGFPLALALLFVCALPAWPSATDAGAGTEPRLLVDTRELTLTVIQGERPQMTLYNIAIGRYGASLDKRRGDNTTPLGRFRVTRIQRNSDFHRFIGLDYPGVDRAQKGLSEGVINAAELQSILGAHRRGKIPPQGTALGGHIGIHGLGQGDPVLHRTLNWTRGCVALTDKQIDALLSWVQIGTTVEIR